MRCAGHDSTVFSLSSRVQRFVVASSSRPGLTVVLIANESPLRVRTASACDFGTLIMDAWQPILGP